MQNITQRLQTISDKRSLRVYHIVLCVLILVLSCLGSLVLGKDLNWDLRNYHFYNPAALLTGRLGFDFFPAQIPNWLNPLMDIPTYAMIMNFKPWVVGAVMGLWHGLNLILVYLIAQSVFHFLLPVTRTLLATLSVMLASTGSIVRGLWGTFTGDLTISIFVLAALFLFLSALTDDSNSRRVKKQVASGLILGVGIGLKMTVLFHAIPLLILTVFLEHTPQARLRIFLRYGTACFIGFILVDGWWMILLQSRYSSPFFPFYNAIFHSPFIAFKNIPEFHWTPTTLIDHLKMPFTYLTGPGQGDVNFRDWRPGIAYGALILLAVNFLWRGITRSFTGFPTSQQRTPMVVLILFTIMSWVIWQVQFSYYRYLSTLEILFPVLIFAITYFIIQRPQVLILVTAVLLVVLLRKTDPLRYERANWGEDYFAVTIPADLHLENSQVLIVDRDRPLAYFVPFFPASTQVIRLTSNLDDAVQDLVPSLLRTQRDQALLEPISKYVMYDERVKPDEQSEIDGVLAKYMLQRKKEPCTRITSAFSNVTVCPVSEVTNR